MKKLLLSLVFISFCIAQVSAQKQTNDPNTGHFDVIKNTAKGEEHINVNYVLQPAPFTNVLNLHLNTPDPMGMSVKIVNESGVTVMNWMPEKVNYTYSHLFDISNLKVGKYHVDVYGDDGKKLHSIVFQKQAGGTMQNSNK